MKTFKIVLYVQVDESEGVTAQDVADHVYSAVTSWGGQDHPDDWSWPSNLTVWGRAWNLKVNPTPPEEAQDD